MELYSFILAVTLTSLISAEITLKHLHTEFVPDRRDPLRFRYNVDAVEKVAIDPSQHIAYGVGRRYVHVYDFTNVENGGVELGTYYRVGDVAGEFTDVDTCDNLVATTYRGNYLPDGRVYIFNSYDPNTQSLEVVREIPLHADPDMIKFTSDCRRILVAIMGRLYKTRDTGEWVEPEGEVIIIETEDFSMKRLDFTSFNDRESEYIAAGVRKIFDGEPIRGLPGQEDFTMTLSQDLEPEYLAINPDNSEAWIILQPNNAVARLNLETDTFEELFSFGEKFWGDYIFDASDRDDRVNLVGWPVYGMYQPDGVTILRIDGVEYLVTANEGNIKREWDASGGDDFTWAESQRGNRFPRNGLIHSSVPEGMRDDLDDNSKLGRLDISVIEGKVEGTSNPVQYDRFVSYGGRSISLFRLEPQGITLHHDTGSELERELKRQHESIFNTNANSNEDSPEGAFDTRSDNRGPEVEAVEIGEVNGKTIIIVGCERPGFLVLYSVDEHHTPQFESLTYNGGFGTDRSFEQLWEDRKIWDLDAEGLRFIPSERSPVRRKPMLVVSAPASGTLSFYVIEEVENTIDETPVAQANDQKRD